MSDPIFRAKFSTSALPMWIAIHVAACGAAKARWNYIVWDLDARTFSEALEEVERTERCKERDITVRLCPCVGGTKGKLPVQLRSGAVSSPRTLTDGPLNDQEAT